jgi:hypothetical protein
MRVWAPTGQITVHGALEFSLFGGLVWALSIAFWLNLGRRGLDIEDIDLSDFYLFINACFFIYWRPPSFRNVVGGCEGQSLEW